MKDAGRYICTASSDKGEDKKDFHLIVESESLKIKMEDFLMFSLLRRSYQQFKNRN